VEQLLIVVWLATQHVLAVQDLLGTNASPVNLGLLYFLELQNVEGTVESIKLGLVRITLADVMVVGLFKMGCVLTVMQRVRHAVTLAILITV
jgi:hypothetical protein